MDEDIPIRRHKSQKAQIMGVLHQMAGGVPAAAPCRAHGMSSATLSTWGAKYGGMDASCIGEIRR